MLTTSQRDEFHRRGLLCLPGAVPGDDAERMRNRIWHHLQQVHGAQPDRPGTWPAGALAHFQSLTRTGAFTALASAPVLEAIDALLGRHGWQQPEQWGRPLVTFPDAASWRLPSRGWHHDSSDRPGDPVLVVFACLAPVEREGGGTLVVTGSHRLTTPKGRYAGLRSAQVRERLAAEHRWFRDLFTPGAEPDRTARLFGSRCEVDRIPLEITELTGSPGDVFLMHPRSLHAVAPNALDTPRLMLLHFVQRQTEQSARRSLAEQVTRSRPPVVHRDMPQTTLALSWLQSVSPAAATVPVPRVGDQVSEVRSRVGFGGRPRPRSRGGDARSRHTACLPNRRDRTRR